MIKAILIPYLSIGLLTAIVVFVTNGAKRAAQSDSNIEYIAIAVRILENSATPPLWLRFQIVRLLASAIWIINWPTMLPHIIRAVRVGIAGSKLSYGELRAKITLSAIQIIASVNVALFALVLLLLRMWSGAEWMIDLGCYLVLVGIAMRLAYNWLQGTDLPSMMRVSLLNPYLQFAIVALVDYLGLVLAALTLNWRDGKTLMVSVLVDEAKSVAAFGQVAQVFRQVPDTLDSIMITIGSVTFAILIIGQVVRVKQFKRTPADHATVITNLMAAGRRSAAVARFQKLKVEVRRDSSMVVPRIWIAIADGRYQYAYDLVEAEFGSNSGLQQMMYSSKTPDDILRRLIELTFGGVRFRRDEQLSVIRFGIDHGISDGCLCLILIDMGDLGIFESANDVSSIGIDDRYPLAQAICTAFLADDDLDDLLRGIIETLSVTDPSVAADRIVRDFLLVLYPLRIGSFDEAILERLLAQVEGTASMPGWLAVNSYVLLSQIGLMMRPDHASQPRLRAQLERTAADSDAEELRRMAAIAMMAAARYNEIAGEPRPAATLPPAT